MLTETEAEEIIVFFKTFLSLVAFQLGGPDLLPPPGYAYALRKIFCPRPRQNQLYVYSGVLIS